MQLYTNKINILVSSILMAFAMESAIAENSSNSLYSNKPNTQPTTNQYQANSTNNNRTTNTQTRTAMNDRSANQTDRQKNNASSNHTTKPIHNRNQHNALNQNNSANSINNRNQNNALNQNNSANQINNRNQNGTLNQNNSTNQINNRNQNGTLNQNNFANRNNHDSSNSIPKNTTALHSNLQQSNHHSDHNSSKTQIQKTEHHTDSNSAVTSANTPNLNKQPEPSQEKGGFNWLLLLAPIAAAGGGFLFYRSKQKDTTTDNTAKPLHQNHSDSNNTVRPVKTVVKPTASETKPKTKPVDNIAPTQTSKTTPTATVTDKLTHKNTSVNQPLSNTNNAIVKTAEEEKQTAKTIPSNQTVTEQNKPTATPESPKPNEPAKQIDTAQFMKSAIDYFENIHQAKLNKNMDSVKHYFTPAVLHAIEESLKEQPELANYSNVRAKILTDVPPPTPELITVRFSGLVRATPESSLKPFTQLWYLDSSNHAKQDWIITGIK